ncbi:tRNA lysidine(34) synthetase TilS [Cereibacter sphaeroides]|uniref:tRNA lysidine(34) synthetase TilS n=1 Tax=Cereibacter sphaeroides TaxID=1063 RepID=UPI001F236193|nr:tRNA lysidine(34) synthetase TilS [Cereibacter sphaeroides]MCE6959405.1 tRNA lysidine(34) synthetase TilS [Cereibacter sphaeroides]MCE6967411.1 tRNA lysidine(34) synthetase TilS [Cereibacter sphaeroides]MCE6973824.1 tRNA lysidine(34) synthetase TilS [Cereibacter sphaeroides]
MPLLQRFLNGPGLADVHALGLAVSGGGDSMALLHLAAEAGIAARAVTVDHGLRPEAALEAAEVARVCAGLGVPHDILRWQGWDGRGNLQDQARRARYRLIADWARAEGLEAVALGHTRDDVAETFLMRLARGAGVDGLAAMQARRRHEGMLWLRPLLGIGREELRDELRRRGAGWVEDPSNENPVFDRARVRKAMKGLAGIGLGSERLAEVAGHLAEVRAALDVQTREAAGRVQRLDRGDVLLDPAALDLPAEVLRRLLRQAILWVASAEYGPRGPALAQATRRLVEGKAVTLHGCRLVRRAEGLRIFREWQAVRSLVASVGARWDGRWCLTGPERDNPPDDKGLRIRALGPEGLALCPDWRGTGLPRASLLASPSVWRDDRLVAAPLAGKAAGWSAVADPLRNDDFLSLLSH